MTSTSGFTFDGSDLNVPGDVIGTGSLGTSPVPWNNLNMDGTIIWDGQTSGWFQMKANNAISPNYTLTWPSADAAGQLESDGSGALSFQIPVYGEIYVAGGSTTQVTNASADTFDLITGFNTAAGADGASNGATNAKASNKITLDTAGTYKVTFSVSWTGTTNETYTMKVYLNGAAQDNVLLERKIGTGTDTGRAACSGYIVAAAGQDLDVRVAAAGTSSDFIPSSMNLNCARVGV